jgi:hypothetical protein
MNTRASTDGHSEYPQSINVRNFREKLTLVYQLMGFQNVYNPQVQGIALRKLTHV